MVSSERARIGRLWSIPSFPIIDGRSLLSIDFTFYASSHEPDVLVHNKVSEFLAHKEILRAISPTLAQILDGDTDSKELILSGISSECLESFGKILYLKPGKKQITFDRSVWLEFLILIAKYEINILKEFILDDIAMSPYSDGESYHEFYDRAEDLQLPDICRCCERYTLSICRNIHLIGFRKEFVFKMIQLHDFKRWPKFYMKIARYAKAMKDASIYEKMHAIMIKGTKEEKSEFAGLKNQMLWKVLRERDELSNVQSSSSENELASETDV